MKFLNHQFRHSSSRRTLFILSGFMLFVSLGVFLNKAAFASDPAASNEQRLVTIHDGENEVTVVTRSITVGDALKQAAVSVSSADIVEPATKETLVAKSYQVNIFRARPIVVIDGSRSVKVMTAEQSPRQIAKAAGTELFDEDTVAYKRTSSLLARGGAGIEMTITRAKVFQFTLYGKKFDARTQAKTIGQLLSEKKITLGTNDGVTPNQSTPLLAGMDVRVWRNGKQTITQEEVVAKPVEEIKDVDKAFGVREVRSAGVDGKKNVTYEIEMRDGVEVARKAIATVITLEPVKEVVVVGAKSQVVPYTGGGSKDEWLAAAGVPREHWGYADSIVQRESGWNPNAVNRSSGACGLAQALPCSKVPGNPYNPVDSLRWMNSYVNGRYYDGSPYAAGLCSGAARGWECAYRFWQAKHWY